MVPPLVDAVPHDWSCQSCKEKTEEYLQARQAYRQELQKRLKYDTFSSFPQGDHCYIKAIQSSVYSMFFSKPMRFPTLDTFRYEGALERKIKILEIIRSLDLPNNPLDDIIDQVCILFEFSLVYNIHLSLS